MTVQVQQWLWLWLRRYNNDCDYDCAGTTMTVILTVQVQQWLWLWLYRYNNDCDYDCAGTTMTVIMTAQVQQGLAVPQGREDMDDACTRNGACAQNQHVGAGHILLLWRRRLAEGDQRLPPGVRQVGRQAHIAADAASQPQHACSTCTLAPVDHPFLFYISSFTPVTFILFFITHVRQTSTSWGQIGFV